VRAAALAVLAVLAAAPRAEARPTLKVRDGAGREVFSLKWEVDGAKLVDPQDRELARLKPRDDRVKINGPDDAPLGVLGGDATKLEVRSGDKTLLFVLRRQADGDYKLEDARAGLLAKLEVKGPDYVRVEDAGGATLYKVKRKGGKIVATDPGDRPVLAAEGAGSLMGFAVLGLERLSQPQRAGLYYRLDALGVR
jgi:hypothetical protein